MPNAGLALLLALAVEPAAPATANEATLMGLRLEQRIAERGPIRLRLEVALGATAIEIAAQEPAAPARDAAAAPARPDHFWGWFLGALGALVFGFLVLTASNDNWF